MLSSKRHFNFTTSTQFGQVTFDEKGESRDLTAEQEQYLAARIQDFNFVDETPEVVPVVEVIPAPEPVTKVPEETKAPVKKRATRKKAETTEK